MSVPTPFHPDPSLLDRLRGADGVHRLIDAFYDRIAADETLEPLFTGFRLNHGRDRVKSFFVEWLGGERDYYRVETRGMRRFHNHLFITRDLADRWLEWFSVALQDVGAPTLAAAELMTTVRALAHHVVNDLEKRRQLLPGRGLRCVRSKVFREPEACIVRDDLPGLRDVVARDPLLPKVTGKAGRTLLWEAAVRGRVGIGSPGFQAANH